MVYGAGLLTRSLLSTAGVDNTVDPILLQFLPIAANAGNIVGTARCLLGKQSFDAAYCAIGNFGEQLCRRCNGGREAEKGDWRALHVGVVSLNHCLSKEGWRLVLNV